MGFSIQYLHFISSLSITSKMMYVLTFYHAVITDEKCMITTIVTPNSHIAVEIFGLFIFDCHSLRQNDHCQCINNM